MATLSKGTNFPAKVVEGMFNTVKGKSTLAKFSNQMPIAFTGNTVFTFAMDKDLAIVAENGAKEHGGVTATPVTIQPIKLEYGARVSDEFLYASEEDRLGIITEFANGFTLELLAYHKTGCGKYTSLGREYTLPDVEPPSVDFMKDLAAKCGAQYNPTGV